MKKIIFLFAAIVALSSCTITKRHYAPGYHVEWRKMRSQNVVPNENVADSQESIKEIETPVMVDPAAPMIASQEINGMNIDRSGLRVIEDMQTENATELVVDNSIEVVQSASAETQMKVGVTESTEAPISSTPPSGNINTLALVGFCLSMSSFLLVITALPGLICSIIGLKQIKAGNGEGKGLAIAGIVVGALYSLIILVYLAYFIFLIAYGGI